MSDLNGPPPDATEPTASENLKSGLTGSPAAKLKLIVVAVIAVGIIAVVAMGSKNTDQDLPKAEASKVAITEVDLEDDDKGAAASNPEVDSLITQVEAERQKTAITDGDTYVAPVPDLDTTPPPPLPQQTATPVYVPVTVSLSTQQAKLAALQGLDERLGGIKVGVVAETQFQQLKNESSTAGAGGATAVTAGASATGPSAADQGPVQKQYPAGTKWFATTTSAIDSDVPGPITARIEQGPFAGGEALGSYEVQGRKYVTMSFSKIVYQGTEYPISAIGINPNNGIAGLEGDVNNHWGSRLILPTLAAAVGKYAEAATFGGVTSVTAGGSVVQQPELSDSEKLEYALGSGVQTGVTPVIQEEANSIKRQVTLPQLSSFGLMLVEGI